MNPRDNGALCDLCPLRDAKPVPGEYHANAIATMVGEAPGEVEEKEGRPFVGPAGMELQRNLSAVGLRRAQFSITNAILCRPPENKLSVVVAEVKRENDRRKKAGRADLALTPMEACRPRLMRELLDATRDGSLNVVALGDVALKTITKSHLSIMEVRGGPREYPGGVVGENADGSARWRPTIRLLPTLHPAFVMRARRWTQAFRADLARAVRWFNGKLEWKDPIVLYQPSPAALRQFFATPTRFFVLDVETAPAYPVEGHYDPTRDLLRCIGFSTADGSRAAVVPFRSVTNTDFRFYGQREEAEIRAIIREFLVNPEILKGSWNGGYYDRMVIESHFGVTPTPHLDGMGLHKFAEPELPHGLGYAGSIYTDVTAWKQGKVANTAESDAELWKYNATDCAVTALTIPALVEAVKARGQVRQARFWPQVQEVCVGLHKNGMWIDQARRYEWDSRLVREARVARTNARESSGLSSLNPGSAPQIRDLLFERWNLPAREWTNGGDPSTDDATLRSLLSTPGVEEKQRATIAAIRDYRYAVKLRGTYVTKMIPIGMEIIDEHLAWDEEESWEERQERLKKDRKKYGVVLEDGRAHPDYNAHGTVGWRLSSSHPNAQNWPRKLRDMVSAEKGRVIVGADMDQLELRFAAALAHAALYLGAFNSGGDPHAVTCQMLYGEQFDKADAAKKKALRDFAKRFSYAVLYRAEDETVHEVITSTEDDDGRLLYANLSLRETSALRRRWLDASPEFEAWWESEIGEWKRNGHLVEPVLGQRIDFLDGERGENVEGKIVNFKCQSGGSALVHLSTIDLLKEIPFGKWGHGTGLIQQGHDALEVEVPCEHERWQVGKPEFDYCPPGCGCEANKTARLLEEVMRRDGRKYGLSVTFTASAKIRKRWHEPKVVRN